ncbi:tRNA methyltransferase [Fragilaria crotonensis]|nr:tRNA methyltransferase [Fragilaria crotonensis]
MVTTTATPGKTASFTFVELFAGIGGFRLGLEAIGGVSVLSNELCPHACKLYESYFGQDRLVRGDVRDLDLAAFPPYTMLTAGFPCQPFSNRGHQRGLDDEKSGQMYLELVRILTETQPPCFLFENVTQLLLLEGGSRSARIKGELGTFVAGGVMERICVSFASCGYHVDWAVINSRHFVAQNRERVYIVGIRNDISNEPLVGWKQRVHPTTSSTTNVRDILEPDDSPAVKASELTQSQWSKIQSMYKSKNKVASIDACIRLDAKAPTLISQYHRVGSLSSKFVCHKLDGSDRDGADGRCWPRFLTPRECCRLMGFPEDFPVHGGVVDEAHLYQAIGNAVTPPVIAAIGRELLLCVGGGVRVGGDVAVHE